MTALHIVTPPLGSTSADLPWICSRLLRPAGPERTPAPRGQPPALNQRVTCPPARVTAGRRTSDGDSTGLQYPLAGRRRVGTEGKRMPRTPRMTDTLRGKTLVYLGAGLAVAGAGAATATAGFAGTTPTASARYDSAARAGDAATAHPGTQGKHQAGQASRHAAYVPASTRHTADRARHRAAHRRHANTWATISRIVANHTVPRAGHGPLPAADRLTPVGTSGPQAWMPITPARWDNATTIVRQAIHMKMGLRAAVIAVATAMQESTLENINYGTYDSLGLFQQRPSAGWGTPGQILRPTYAADAFYNALRTYQANNPDWSHQPLWQPAQGVQGSAFPYAYAKWEAQAASLVAAVTKHLI